MPCGSGGYAWNSVTGIRFLQSVHRRPKMDSIGILRYETFHEGADSVSASQRYHDVETVEKIPYTEYA